MKPSKIFDILDIALRIRKAGGKFNPLFAGAPGLGKSEICQAWVKNKRKDNPNFGFIDLRAAYLEAPDMIGFPSIERRGEGENARNVTVHNIPDFWPTDGEGLILLEEPNRGTTSVMNTFMQMLTDHKIHFHDLPKGWMFAACINPEGSEYDVNTMDSALKNRFEIFDVVYDKEAFVSFMHDNDWDKSLILFIESGLWQYKLPEEIGSGVGAVYVSPRTFSKVNNVLKYGELSNKDEELLVLQTILGKAVGRDFYSFRHDESPVLYKDLAKVGTKKAALRKLAKFSDPKNFKNGMISITVQDILENETRENLITDELIVELTEVLPVDQSTNMIRELEFKRSKNAGKDVEILLRLCEKYPEVKEKFKAVLKVNKK